MKKFNGYLSTSITFAALFYLAGCGEDNPPATNTAPVFEEETYTFTLAENAASGDEIGSVSATDADENATLTYSITTTQTDFAIDESTGSVTVAEAALDFESTTSYTLEVQVSDGTDTDTADLTITLTDVNEFLPEFANDSYEFEIAADAADGDEVGKIAAVDADGTAQLTYSIDSEGAANFAITDGANVASGEEATVTVAADADLPSLTSPVKLTIMVSDGENTANAEVEIVITSVGTGTNAAPVFANTPYRFNVASDATDGAVVGTVSAMDTDAGAMLKYSLSGTDAGHFAIDHTAVASGMALPVTVATNADLPSLTSPVTLTVTVSDGTLMATANVEITIIAGNVAPVFDQTTYTFAIASGAAGGAIVGPVSATDSNAGAMLKYSLSGTDADHFAISNTPVTSGTAVPVTVASNEDLSSLTSPVALTVTVTDEGTLTATATVEITITAAGANVAPVFASTDYTFTVAEDAAEGAVLGTVSASDSDAGDRLTYSLSGTNAGHFEVKNGTDVASGTAVSVVVASGANLPSLTSPVTIVVTVTDDATSALTATANVEITITAGNVAPVFDQTAYTFAVNEDAESGDVVDAVSATDSNAGDLLIYTISGEGADNFAISNTAVASGTPVQITVSGTASLDHETVASYTLEVQASDDAVPTLTATAAITINVGDVNDNDPVFAQASYIFSVDENSVASTLVGMVSATDADAGTTLAYRITTTQTDFEMDASTGEIKVASASLDFETTASYTLQVEASDGTKTATAEVTVNVDNVNEAPTFTGAPYTFSIDENSATSTVVDVVVATDVDTNTTLEYSITTSQTNFDINANGEITVGPNTMLDFETTPSYTLEVQASDGATPALTATAAVTINVNDLNDEAPVFGETAYTFEIVGVNATSGDEVGTVAATDADAGATLQYSIATTQTEFDIDANTGIITVSDAAVFDRSTTPSYTLMVQASDGANTGTAMLTINILGVDYDVDGDGLIDINNLEQLNAMRWDLDGDGMPVAANTADYEAAFPDAATFDPTPTGYELMRDLDFDEDDSYAGVETDQTWSEAQGTTSGGWDPIGDFTSETDFTPYTAVFEGNDQTLSNLYINRNISGVGLFVALGAASTVSGLGLVGVSIMSGRSAGSLVGYSNGGTITACHATGQVSGTSSVGGLVGLADNGSIIACYAAVAMTGSGTSLGGLVGATLSGTRVIACYATGTTITTETTSVNVGGLVGDNSGTITACYATGAVTSHRRVGGLVGNNIVDGTITACYATGVVTGAFSSQTGGLIGDDSGTATASYFNIDNTVQTDATQGKDTDELQTPTAYGTASTDIYSTWNLDVDNADGDDVTTTGTDDPWDFGTSDQYPVLKIDFNNDGSTADDVTRQRQ